VLVAEYKITPEQAQILYSLLFLHVFKLLSRPGIKRLTVGDRDALVAAPYLDQRDQALLENLKIYLTNLSERVGALEDAVSLLQQRPMPTASEIRDACRKATIRLARVLIDDQKIIERESFKDKIDEFLSSPLRYCFVLGPSGVGKSISTATEAEQLLKEGRSVLLIPGKYFSLEEAAQLITQRLISYGG
jgi:signal recognition particle GTPase